jgi:hypothetical protein
MTTHRASMLPGGSLKAEGFGDGECQSLITAQRAVAGCEKQPQAALGAAAPVNGYDF